MSVVSRRWVISALLASAAAPALGNAPTRSPIPQARPELLDSGPPVPPSVESLIEAARLNGRVCCMVADARSGVVLEARSPDQAAPPASVVKAVTAAYALDRLGSNHRFRTRLIATGPMRGSRIEGDLVLLGGGDPVLTADHLGDMALALRDQGITGITGRFIVHDGALPRIERIADDQPVAAAYNPAISGLNMNFNRVHFRWERSGSSYRVVMEAPDMRFRPAVSMARMQLVDRPGPVYTFTTNGTGSAITEDWTVAAPHLGNAGGRQLPVRNPDIFAGDVFRTIAAFYEIPLPAPQRPGGATLRGDVLVEHVSPDLTRILRDMLEFSTNLTAEVVGLAASGAGGTAPTSLAASGRQMSDWARSRFGVRSATFADHSGLGDSSRIGAEDMVRFLTGSGANGALRALLRDFPMRDGNGSILRNHPLSVAAKTGTLNFVSGLGGYVATPSGRELAFAIFSADLDTRARLTPEQREGPPGGSEWLARARRLQQQLIERWGTLYA